MEVQEVQTDETPIQIQAGNWRAKCSRPKCHRIIEGEKDDSNFIVKQGDFVLCQMKICFRCTFEQPIPIMYQSEATAQDAARRLKNSGFKTDQRLVLMEDLNLVS